MTTIDKIALHREKNLFQSLFGGDSPTFSSPSSSGRSSPTEESGASVLVDATVDELLDSNITVYQSPLHPQYPIRIMERKALGIAHQLWPAAGFLGDFIAENHHILAPNNEQNVSLIELGAGLGLTGLFLASLFDDSDKKLVVSRVVLTDLPEALAGLQENITLNNLNHKVDAAVLSWGNMEEMKHVMSQFGENPPVIVGADVVYWECLFGPLVETLLFLCATCRCTAIIGHIKRWKKDNKFFSLCKKRNLTVETLHEEKVILPHEHTKEDTKQIRRIYKIYYNK